MNVKSQIFFIAALFATVNAFAHSDAIKPEFVDTLVQPYLQIQQALAEDDLEASKQAAENFMEAMAKGPSKEGKPSIAKLEIAGNEIVKSTDIGAVRGAFSSLSQQMKPLIEHVGTSGESPLYLAHCPMAFDGEGGTWIQDSDQIANPYYGSMMLRCGSVQKQIAGESKKLKKSHEGHHSNHSSNYRTNEMLKPASPEIIAQQAKDYPNVCVVSDEPLVEGEIEEYSYKGKLVRFCCKSCKKDFMKDPETYLEMVEKLKSESPVPSDESHSGHDHAGHTH
ncbi:MAG: DUF3347 domain-containing protein [Opitutaceae bacterium]|nr:DUF3347 domain-containing protein [Opitutaceae bacterium]